MTIDPKAIAAEIMTDYARDVGSMDIAAYVMPRNNGIMSASLIDAVADLIAETDVDLIWPDGTRQSKLDAALAEAEQYREAARHYSALAAELTAERDAARDMANEVRNEAAQALRALDQARAVIEAATRWRTAVGEGRQVRDLAFSLNALAVAVDALPTADGDDKPCCGYCGTETPIGVTR